MTRLPALLTLAAATVLAQVNPTLPKSVPAPPRRPPAAAPSGVSSYKDLKYPELHPIVFPKVETVTLPNGLRVYLLEDHEVPLINGTVLVRTGSLFDPPDKIGLCALTAQGVIEGGIATKPGDALIRRFQDLGANIDGTVAENSLSLSFSALKENSDEVLDMLKDALIAPEFQQERIDFAKARMSNSIAHRNDDGPTILRREFAATVYGKNTPYGAQLEYTNLDRINRGDLVSFHQRYFFPKNVMLSVEGDFDAAAMKARLEALFVDWKNDQQPVPEFPKVSLETNPGRFLATKKEPLGYFSVGQLGGDYLDKDLPALQIMSDILGRAPRGRLNRQLRGIADSLSANWAPGFGHPGLFRITATINPFRITEALQIVYKELNTIRAAEVTEEELKSAKDAALNSLVFAFDNQLSVMPRLLEYEYFNFPKDYTAQYQKGLENVTRADVLRVARDHIDPAKLTTVVVANPAMFEAQLDALGSAVAPIDLTIPPPKVEAVLGDPSTQRRGKEMLARAQQAMGGADKLAAVTDYVQESVYQFDPSAGGMQATLTERWLSPGYLRQDNVMPTGKVAVFCDGKTGWVGATQGSNTLSAVQLKQVQSDLFRILFPIILSDRAPSRKVNALDDNTVEVSDSTGQLVKLVFDSAGLLKNMLYQATTATGTVSVVDAYSDYRDVAGLKLPFKVVISVSGQKLQDVTVKNLQLNVGLKLPDLEKRP